MTAERHIGRLRTAEGAERRREMRLPCTIWHRTRRQPDSGTPGGPIVPPYVQPFSRGQRATKRALDIAIAGSLTLLLLPLMLALAALVALQRTGPVLVHQEYFGFEQRKIALRRFRGLGNGTRQTRLGPLLWRSGLNELPLLLDVLDGRLSLVGPQAHALAHDERCRALIDRHLMHHRVRPGITGWAQINGWGDAPSTLDNATQRLAHDLFYLDRWSPLFDLLILAQALLGTGGGGHAR